jgi:hypothetical protein
MPDSQRAGYLMPYEQPAHGGRDHHISLGKLRRQRAAQTLGVPGILQHERALEVLPAVQARPEQKMPVEQRVHLPENLKHFRLGHVASQAPRVIANSLLDDNQQIGWCNK